MKANAGGRLAAGVFLAGTALTGVLCGGAQAADIVVSNGQTLNNPVLLDPNQKITIEAGGTVTHTIVLNDDGQTLVNDGTMSAPTGAGVQSTGDNATITSSGTISALNQAIVTEGASPTITNSGDIDTTADYGNGIAAATGAVNAVITNSGSITTLGAHARGILAYNDGARITNSGTVTTDGGSANGAAVFGDRTSFTNSGSITTNGSSAYVYFVDGEEARFTNSGSLKANGANATALYFYGGNFQGTNSGSITTTASQSFGMLLSGGTGGSFTNTSTGTIATDGLQSSGVNMQNSGSTFTNAGSITTLGNQARGIFAGSSNVTVRNSGTISTQGTSAPAVMFGSSGSFTNSGTVTAAGSSSHAVHLDSGASTVVNSGRIAATGDNGYGIYAIGSNQSITNSGTISATGAGSYGIFASSSNQTVINSGTISSSYAEALYLAGINQTLTLKKGSAIDGGIFFASPSTATLNVAGGFSTVLTINGVPTTITTGGQSYVVSGNKLSIVDTSGLSAVGSGGGGVGTLTGSISGAVGGRMAGVRSGGSTSMLNSYAAAPAEDVFDAVLTPRERITFVWADAFGGVSQREASSGRTGFGQAHGGGVVGIDRRITADTLVGAFAGGSAGSMETEAKDFRQDTSGAFAGVYLGHTAGAVFTDLSLTAGVSMNESTRRIVNGGVPGGFEYARADYDSHFVSPSLTVGVDHAAGMAVLTPSLGLRYAGVLQQGYTETGSTANLTAGDRVTHVIELRGQFAATVAASTAEGGSWQATARTGVDGVFNWGDDISMTLAGTPITVAAGDDDTVARGFVGLDLAYAGPGGLELRTSAEAGYDSAETLTANLRARVGLRF